MLAIVGRSSRDLDAPPGLIATCRWPERRKFGVFVYMSTSIGARPALCVSSYAPRTLSCCQYHYQLTNSILRGQPDWTKQLTYATVRCPMRIGPFPSRRLVTPIITLFTWYLFINVFYTYINCIIIIIIILKRAKCVERQVMVWNEDSVARLQSCFDCTNWDVFRDSCDSLDDLTML